MDVIILPAGFGVAKNLSNLEFMSPDAVINHQLKNISITAIEHKKPIGAK